MAFVVAYGIQKYLAARPPAFELSYLGSVSLLTVMTVLIPFAVLWWIGRTIQSIPLHAIVALIAGAALAMAGFALFWQFYIIPYFEPDPPFWAVVRRGLTPGLFMGAILVLGRWLSVRR